MKWKLEFYQKQNKKIPVKDFLLKTQTKMRAKIVKEIELLEMHGLDLKEPYIKKIIGKKYKNLYELRIKFSTNITRIIFFVFKEKKIILLNGFIKKTNKTPLKEIEKSLNYKNDYEKRCNYE